MTAVATQSPYAWDNRRSETSICWVCAAIFAGILHFVAIWAVIHWLQPVVMQNSPSAAAEAVQMPMALELVQDLQPAAAQPLPASQEMSQEMLQEKPQEKSDEKAEAPPPETSEAKAEERPEPIEKSEPVEAAVEEPKPAEPKPAEPEKTVAEKQPDLPRSNDKAAEPAAAAKPHKAATRKPPPPTPVRAAPARPVQARAKPTPVVRRQTRVATRPAPVSNQRAERAAAAAAAQASAAAAAAGRAAAAAASAAASSASWRASLMAHLNRYKRFPPGASPGSVSVSFTIDRSGGVRSASLARSSGNSALDAEAVAMVRRASPVPPPPAGVGGSSMAIAVPIRFSR